MFCWVFYYHGYKNSKIVDIFIRVKDFFYNFIKKKYDSDSANKNVIKTVYKNSKLKIVGCEYIL